MVQVEAFTTLVIEVIAMWRVMEILQTTGAFCLLLSEDEQYVGDGPYSRFDFKNKSRLSAKHFLLAMRSVFYLVLDDHGIDKIVQPYNVLPGSVGRKSYIDRLMERIQEAWEIKQDLVDAKVKIKVQPPLGEGADGMVE